MSVLGLYLYSMYRMVSYGFVCVGGIASMPLPMTSKTGVDFATILLALNITATTSTRIMIIVIDIVIVIVIFIIICIVIVIVVIVVLVNISVCSFLFVIDNWYT